MVAADPAPRMAFVARLVRAWGNLNRERRLTACAAFAMFLTLFLPWYRVTVVQLAVGKRGHYRVPTGGVHLPATQTFSGWGAFSFVEGAVLIVAVSVLVLLFKRAEGKAFHLPGGDGTVITIAGAWTCFLVIWRMFDKQGVSNEGQLALSSGISWGIFVALAVAAVLTYCGARIRVAHQPEPPLPTENYAVFDGKWHESSEHTAVTVATGRRASERRDPERNDPDRRRRRPPRTPASVPIVASQSPSAPLPTAPLSAGRAALPSQDPTPPASSRRRRPARSNWRPAESPEWSGDGPDRQPGWLSATRRAPAASDEDDTVIDGES
jgi:hypothetical protein